MPLNCGAGKDSWGSFGLHRDQTSQPKINEPWIFIERTGTEAEAPKLWPPDAKSWFNGKDHDAGKDWKQKDKGRAEDEMARQHHRLNRHEFEQILGDSGGQGSWHATVHGVARCQAQLNN